MTNPQSHEVPPDLWQELDPSLPVLMLPVRLETRWGRRDLTEPTAGRVVPGGMPVLRVRVYPDDISVARPDAASLSAAEVAAGQRFWARHGMSGAGASVPRRMAAWEVFTREVGVERARHIALNTRPGAPDPAGDAQPGPAIAWLLPDAWVLAGYHAGERVLSGYVPVPAQRLQVGLPEIGPDRAPPFDLDDPLLIADPALRWLTDFDLAQQRGMAFTVDLMSPAAALAGQHPDWLVAGLDSLLVFGVRARAAGDPQAEADALAALMKAHAADGEASFLPVGTPTNNLPGTHAGWSSQPAAFADYAPVVSGEDIGGAAGPEALRGAAGANAATALGAAWGLDPRVFASLRHADDTSLCHAGQMAAALFPATLGEAVRTLQLPADPALLAAGRVAELAEVSRFAAEHWTDYVRGRGPLPVLRIGRQPYGVLPVTPLGHYRPGADDPPLLAGLVALLRRLRPFWSSAAGMVPRLERRPGDRARAASQLVRILQQGPVPHPGAYQLQDCQLPVWPAATGTPLDLSAATYGAVLRPYTADQSSLASELGLVLEIYPDAVGVAIGEPGPAVLGEPLDPRWRAAAAVRRDGLRELATRLLRTPEPTLTAPPTLLDSLVPLRRARLTTPVATSEAGSSPASYLAALAAGQPPGERPPDLLYRLVEQSLRLAGAPEYAGELLTEARDRSYGALRDRHERFRQRAAGYLAWVSEHNRWVDAGEHGPGPSLPAGVSATANQDDPADDPPRPWYELPGQPEPATPTGEPAFPQTGAAVAALAAAALADHEYVRLLGETVACASTRLDAWLTSLATRRLVQQRRHRPAGIQLGCWGAVVNLSWREPNTVEGPAGWRAPDGSTGVRLPARQVGYVHAPSLAQARTAGVLRAAELSHHGDGSTLASLDLTSWRARTARDLLEAVGNGQPLGAVLGDWLERALGEADRHDCVTRLREAFPQHRAGGEVGTPAAGADAVVPTTVVDGLEVWQAGAERIHQLCPGGGEPLRAALAGLDRAVEAVADTLVAEGVHELVSGRTELAAATFAALAEGERPPLELAVLESPCDGVAISHRLLLALDPRAAVPGWQRSRPRARLAAAVEGWAETVLGEPGGYRAAVTGRARTGAPVTATVSLDALGLCALDVVVESAGAAGPAGAGPWPGSPAGLVARLGAAAGVESALAVADTGDGTWDRLTALAGAVAEVLAGARPAAPADLAPEPEPELELAPDPSPGSTEEVDPAEPAGREAAAQAVRLEPVAHELAAVLDELSRGIDEVAEAVGPQIDDDQPVPDHLLVPFERLGLPGSSCPAGTATAGVVRTAAAAAKACCAEVWRMLYDEPELAEPRTQPAWQDLLRATSRTPMAAARLTAVARRLAGEAVVPVPPVPSALPAYLLPAGEPGPAELEEWLEQISRVRPRAAAYAELRWFAEAGGGVPEPLCAAQLAHPAGVAGDERWRGRSRAAGVRAVVAGPAAAAGELPVLVLDEFDELLPDPDVTTGLALHYEAPAARAPQTMLLAVHPDPDRPWSADLLDATIREALELARLRSVDHEDLERVVPAGHVPLTYLMRREVPFHYPWPQPHPPVTNPDLYDPWEILRQIREQEDAARALWLAELERKLAKLLRGEPPDEEEWDWLQRCFDADLAGPIPYPPAEEELAQFRSHLTGKLAEIEQLPPVLSEVLGELAQEGPGLINRVGPGEQPDQLLGTGEDVLVVPEEVLVVPEEVLVVPEELTPEEALVVPEEVPVTADFLAANRVIFRGM